MNNNLIKKEDSSFRDNKGSIFYLDNKVLRTVNKSGAESIDFILKKKILEEAINKKFLINTQILNKQGLPSFFSEFEYVLESELIPFISYPYEWSFEQLKTAALHHLDFQIFLFDRGAVLRDSSAYNIQFIGSIPYFIDLLSIKKYEEGEYWIGYKQFCENFLNPLLLGSLKGVCHNNWFRGCLEGISSIELNKILSFKDIIIPKVFTHVYLQAKLNVKSIENSQKISSRYKKLKGLPKSSYISIIHQLRDWIKKLSFKKERTIWQNYSTKNTYNEIENNQKKKVVSEFVKRLKPKKLIDLGCNDGNYSLLSLSNGAEYVVGFDFDHNTISKATRNIIHEKKNFLPLLLDASNPSPNQGWFQRERKGFIERFKADALIALAFEHHLIIGKNIPMQEFIDWITDISDYGLIEFVPKSDETIQRMLEFREDIFFDYSEKKFEMCLQNKAKIINKNKVTKNGRIIYEYKKDY